ncbi:MAG: type II secretion system F family protein [Acidobacteriota bacterium]
MELIVALVFLAVFALIALPMLISSIRSSRKSKNVQAALDAALASEGLRKQEDIVDLRKDDELSDIPWLNKKLQDFNAAPRLNLLLHQADLKWSVGRLLSISALSMVVPAYLVYLRTRFVVVALAVGIVTGLAPFGWVLFMRKKRFERFIQGMPEALDLMVSALRAGHSFHAAMGLVARECAEPIGGEFKLCFEEQNYGLELKGALDNLQDRVPLQDLRIATTAIMIQKESGGNLAEVLEKVSSVIRERFRLKRQVMTHTAQGRLTGMILTLLPVALGFLIYLINPKMMSLLWKDPIGVKLLWAASILIIIGGMIIRKIVNMEV